ncbi:NAD(P)/FAD-dependent oxidoreductase [Sphingomonas sp. 2378]|uniref:NAD(P)/FAD-dependent oxidoreductase n=1 Tax=Sphingomonas sp. 2378 TaxID=1219748 RepID=UPI00311AC5BA
MPRRSEQAVIGAWAGSADSTSDGVSGIGEVDQLPGLVLAAGFSGHGFGIGPGAGHLIADIVSGATPIVDLPPYHPSRFASSARSKVAEFWSGMTWSRICGSAPPPASLLRGRDGSTRCRPALTGL